MAVNPMMDARSAGISGINAGMNGAADAAREIAELNVLGTPPAAPSAAGTGDPAEALVDLRLYQRQVEASAVVVETADAVVGFLLDAYA